MNSGMHKPPLAPKPKLVQSHRPGFSPSTTRREGLSLPSPGTQRRVKPVLAPKPCLSKLTATVQSKALTSKSLHQTSVTEDPQTIGLLNSQNGLQQENKKPNWDYIIPICLCSRENCQCVRNTSLVINKVEKELKISHKGKHEDGRRILHGPSGAVGNKERTDTANLHVIDNSPQNARLQPPSTNTNLSKHEPLQEMLNLDKNPNTDISASSPVVNIRQPLPHRTWSDEANGNVIPQSSFGHGPKEDAICSVPQPKPAHTKPVPLPRKPRTSVLALQEKVEKAEEEIICQEGRDVNVREVKVPSEGKDSSSLSVSVPVKKNSQPIVLSVRKACAPPAPPPQKKAFLSAPEQVPTEALAKDVEEEDLGWDSSIYQMEISVDEEDKELEKAMEENEDQGGVYTNLIQSPSCSLPDQLEIYQPPAITMAAENGAVKMRPKKPQRHSSPMACMQKDSFQEKEMEKSGDNERGRMLPSPDCVLKERAKRELPLPPREKVNNNNHLTAGIIKPPRSSLGKPRAKSFSGADLISSNRQRKNSFQKLMDLKLSVKMLPKLIAKGSKSADSSASDHEQSVDNQKDVLHTLPEYLRGERKFSCPLIGVEQSVDGEEFCPGIDQDVYYENIRHYEEIPVYMNANVGEAEVSPQAALSQPTAWHNEMYNDDGIYEEQEPYMPFEKSTRIQLCQTPTQRSSASEEMAPMGDEPTDDDDYEEDDFEANTSFSEEEDENDSSSISSKGDAEQPEENLGAQKKSKIHHIATEIMSSENVFVDVLKLLHVDFREAVSKASRQNGKPVIEERLLSQILYYLPQLYELNQDLLRELRQRLAKWDEKAQLADIFLKKGPYLKMYSTYIREFDKNVALLDEQSKRNLAFGAVVREFEATPRCAGLAIKHYLLKPIQRIPQYQLLLTDYLKNLSEDSDDYKDTQAALALVKEVANHANDIMKQGDNFQKLIQVQCSLNGHHEIVQPGRVFLKEGVLMKLSRKVMQPRMFFLFNDMLLYTTPVQSGQYKLKNMLCLAGMKVSKPSQEAYQNELNIESVERSFILSASSATERDEWLVAISTAIGDYTRKKITFINGKPSEEVDLTDSGDGAPLGSKAPIWIPDPRTTMCMICTCEFSIAWRRHHCRACGKVVCQSCSSKKHHLEYLKNQLARVCDQCYVVLQQQKSQRSPFSVVSPGSRGAFGFTRKHKKIPAALKEVTANTDNSSISGYLHLLRSKGNKKQGKRLWFVIKNKVLYMYAASEDVAALESQPLLGFVLKEDSSQKLQFKLYHKNTLYYSFKADDIQTAQRWISSFGEATVL
ncbi:FYVE, and PH domain-containing 6-like [Solea senegalensis]|uniref:FYVE, and PH domain-containing 6-like n=1 Tax=Solea senegalensis TaxID=28829 RepID=A0AAV6T0L1_SOLSE|nr:FYVE, RhoGEF and PH domain-containing protein 6-like [Solea senegalensis]KAG7522925.1 FYVE, and PH domain-containing 6-like [Solea senegalensis]